LVFLTFKYEDKLTRDDISSKVFFI
jgi:hypothetical protein